MKLLLFPVFFFFTSACYAQDILNFEYDESGNQVLRELICISCDDECVSCRKSKAEKSDTISEDSQLQYINLYPNPVQEVLNVQWELSKGTVVNKIELFSFNGKLLASADNLAKSESTTLNFTNLAQGVYTVIITGNDNFKKSYKILKK